MSMSMNQQTGILLGISKEELDAAESELRKLGLIKGKRLETNEEISVPCGGQEVLPIVLDGIELRYLYTLGADSESGNIDDGYVSHVTCEQVVEWLAENLEPPSLRQILKTRATLIGLGLLTETESGGVQIHMPGDLLSQSKGDHKGLLFQLWADRVGALYKERETHRKR